MTAAEWIALVSVGVTGLVALASIAAQVRSSTKRMDHERDLAREERSQTRKEQVYLELLERLMLGWRYREGADGGQMRVEEQELDGRTWANFESRIRAYASPVVRDLVIDWRGAARVHDANARRARQGGSDDASDRQFTAAESIYYLERDAQAAVAAEMQGLDPPPRSQSGEGA